MMTSHFGSRAAVVAALVGTFAGSAQAANSDIRITEWMYKSLSDPGEFIELTNFGTAAVSVIGWSQDDSNRQSGTHSMTGFGSIAVGESVILTEMNANAFRTQWGLASTVKVIGYGSSHNLASGDEINIYDAAGLLVDRLTYGSTGPATNGTSGRPSSIAALGANDSALWTKSVVGDVEQSWVSTVGDVGSPGRTSFVSAVPEPAAPWMALASLGVFALVRRRMTRG